VDALLGSVREKVSHVFSILECWRFLFRLARLGEDATDFGDCALQGYHDDTISKKKLPCEMLYFCPLFSFLSPPLQLLWFKWPFSPPQYVLYLAHFLF
jgi:hypothetical protein